MAFPAFLDTCVLFPQHLNDTLLTQAAVGTFRPLWSKGVLDELGRVLRDKTQMSSEQVDHRLGRMRSTFPDAEVQGYEHLIDGMACDDFLLDQLDLYPAIVLDCLHKQVNRYTRIAGPLEVVELLRPLGRAGVPRFADEVRRHLL